MPRKALKILGSSQRLRFRAEYKRKGIKKSWRGREETTILLVNVICLENGKQVSDHLWFNYTKGFSKVLGHSPKTGDLVEFDARVASYTKGYFGYRDDVDIPISTDWKLSHPTKIERQAA